MTAKEILEEHLNTMGATIDDSLKTFVLFAMEEYAQEQVKNCSIPDVTKWAFNLNKNIRVKLLDKGYQRLADLHNEFIGRVPNWQKRDAEFYKQQADQDGYTSFQAWTFMDYFGEVTTIGMHGYYRTEILIAANDITPCL